MQVPLLDLKPQYQPLKDDIALAIERVVESQGFILGPEVSQFEEQVAQYCHSKFALGVSSGTDALILALMGLGIGEGDEVITSPYTFFATAGSIARVGAKSVFVDIDPISYNLDVSQVEKKITGRTKAIMPVHLYGQCVEMDELCKISEKHGIPLIEDAAQAIGSEYKGRRAGSFGGIGCFSFFPSKNLGAFGDAGLVTTDDEKLFEHLKIMRVHGGERRYYHDYVGGNFRIDALQAAILSVKLRHLESWTEGRRSNAATYRSLFEASGIAGKDLKSACVVLPEEGPHHRHIYNQYVIRVRDREKLINELTKEKIGTAIYYPLPLHLQKCFSDLGYKKGDLPQSESAADTTLAIPIFPELSVEQLEFVVHVIAGFYKNQ